MKLSIGERIRLLGLLTNYKGSLVDVRIVNDLVQAMGFDEKEIKKDKIAVGTDRVTWDDKAKKKDINIGDRGMEIITGLLKDRDEKKELTVSDIPLCDLFIKEK